MPRDNCPIHPIGCSCAPCNGAPQIAAGSTCRTLTRALLLLAALWAIPFIIAHALACARGDNR